MQQTQSEELSYLRYLIETTPIPIPTSNQLKFHVAISNIEHSGTPIDTQTAVQMIIDRTCKVTGVSKNMVMNHRSRKRNNCFTRNLIVLFALKFTKVSLNQLARYMWQGTGKPRHHTTIIHSRDTCKKDIEAQCNKNNFYKNYLILAHTFEELFAETTVYGTIDASGN